MTKYRREYPRISGELQVEIQPGSGALVHATAVNISYAGLQLVCDQDTVKSLLAGGLRAPPGERLEIAIQLVPASQEGVSATVKADCRTVFTRRVSEREYRIGVSFHEFEEDGYELLESYIDAYMSNRL